MQGMLRARIYSVTIGNYSNLENLMVETCFSWSEVQSILHNSTPNLSCLSFDPYLRLGIRVQEPRDLRCDLSGKITKSEYRGLRATGRERQPTINPQREEGMNVLDAPQEMWNLTRKVPRKSSTKSLGSLGYQTQARSSLREERQLSVAKWLFTKVNIQKTCLQTSRKCPQMCAFPSSMKNRCN